MLENQAFGYEHLIVKMYLIEQVQAGVAVIGVGFCKLVFEYSTQRFIGLPSTIRG